LSTLRFRTTATFPTGLLVLFLHVRQMSKAVSASEAAKPTVASKATSEDNKIPAPKPSHVLIECTRCKGMVRVTDEYDRATRALAFRLCNQCSWSPLSSPPD